MSDEKAAQPEFAVNLSEPMFEVRGPEGQVWMIHFNGKTSGFPPGSMVINHGLPCIHSLMSALRKQGVTIAEEKAWGWKARG